MKHFVRGHPGSSEPLFLLNLIPCVAAPASGLDLPPLMDLGPGAEPVSRRVPAPVRKGIVGWGWESLVRSFYVSTIGWPFFHGVRPGAPAFGRRHRVRDPRAPNQVALKPSLPPPTPGGRGRGRQVNISRWDGRAPPPGIAEHQVRIPAHGEVGGEGCAPKRGGGGLGPVGGSHHPGVHVLVLLQPTATHRGGGGESGAALNLFGGRGKPVPNLWQPPPQGPTPTAHGRRGVGGYSW